jgi:hypothetical protein
MNCGSSCFPKLCKMKLVKFTISLRLRWGMLQIARRIRVKDPQVAFVFGLLGLPSYQENRRPLVSMGIKTIKLSDNVSS